MTVAELILCLSQMPDNAEVEVVTPAGWNSRRALWPVEGVRLQGPVPMGDEPGPVAVLIAGEWA